MTEIKRKIMFSKAYGNASKNSYTCKMAIPSAMMEALNLSQDDREVVMKIEPGKVIIEKA